MNESQRSSILYSIAIILIAFVTALLLFYFQGHASVPVTGHDNASIRLVFVGDVMLSRHVGDVIDNESPEFPFDRIRTMTAGGDITVGNLESPVSGLTNTTCDKKYCFRASPDAVVGLTYAGFDLMNLANNHVLDYGPDVINDTLAALSHAGIRYTGVRQDVSDRVQDPVIMNTRGVNVAFVGFNDFGNANLMNRYPRPYSANTTAVRQAVAQAHGSADIVVVLFHFGKEYEFNHSQRQQDLAYAASDAGADIVVGTHPHVIQDIEVYNGTLIAYSLGNFVFDSSSGRDGVWEGGLLSVSIDPVTKRIQGYSLDTVTIARKSYQPRLNETGVFVPFASA